MTLFVPIKPTAELTLVHLNVKEAQQMLSKYQAPLSMEIVDRIEAVRWIFYRVKDRMGKAMDELLTVQSTYQEGLRQTAIILKDEIDDFIEAFHLVNSTFLYPHLASNPSLSTGKGTLV